jgi:hypothetical protein
MDEKSENDVAMVDDVKKASHADELMKFIRDRIKNFV